MTSCSLTQTDWFHLRFASISLVSDQSGVCGDRCCGWWAQSNAFDGPQEHEGSSSRRCSCCWKAWIRQWCHAMNLPPPSDWFVQHGLPGWSRNGTTYPFCGLPGPNTFGHRLRSSLWSTTPRKTLGSSGSMLLDYNDMSTRIIWTWCHSMVSC